MREIIKLEEWMTPIDLNESTEFETLTEGKILNAIRWKLAKFSLRFLKESAVDKFIRAYYTDEKNYLSDKGVEWLGKSKKEKLKKIRDLADNLKEEEKQKVINSEAAKQCEKQAVKSGIFAGVAGIGSLVANHAYNNRDRYSLDDKDVDINIKYENKGKYSETQYGSGSVTYDITSKEPIEKSVHGSGTVSHTFGLDDSMPRVGDATSEVRTYVSGRQGHGVYAAYRNMSELITSVASFLYYTMWGSLIATGASLIKAGVHAHRANVIRREEIMKQLMSPKRNLEEDFEFASMSTLLNEYHYLYQKHITLPVNLNESTEFETLTEGKILNAIRWKLAKFSLRFLKESAIDEFLKLYYTDKDGKLAPKGKEWLAKSKKEKIKKMKDLADNLKEEEKQKVINSEAAKQCEKQAVKSGIFAGVAGIGAAVSGVLSNRFADGAKSNDYYKDSDVYIDDLEQTQTDTVYADKTSNSNSQGKSGAWEPNLRYHSASLTTDYSHGQGLVYDSDKNGYASIDNAVTATVTGKVGYKTQQMLSTMANVLRNYSSGFFAIMCGSLLATGASLIKAGVHAHSANVMRREEIMKQLMSSKRNLKEDFEFASIGALLNEVYYL